MITRGKSDRRIDFDTDVKVKGALLYKAGAHDKAHKVYLYYDYGARDHGAHECWVPVNFCDIKKTGKDAPERGTRGEIIITMPLWLAEKKDEEIAIRLGKSKLSILQHLIEVKSPVHLSAKGRHAGKHYMSENEFNTLNFVK